MALNNSFDLQVNLTQVPTLGPNERIITAFCTTSCDIFGLCIDGILCGAGLTLMFLFLLTLIIAGIVKLVRSVRGKKFSEEKDLISVFKRKVQPYLQISVRDLPQCLKVELYDSLHSERFETWRLLGELHDLQPEDIIYSQASNGLETNAMPELTLSEIIRRNGNNYKLETLLSDLFFIHREDVCCRLVMHSERCLRCKGKFARYLKGSSLGDRPSSSLSRIFNGSGSSINNIGFEGAERFLPDPNQKLQAPLLDQDHDLQSSCSSAEELNFWREKSSLCIATDAPYCIREIMHNCFNVKKCTLLRRFHGLTQWPENLLFSLILEKANPAEEYLTGYLGFRPRYTFGKLKRDMDRLGDKFLISEVQRHFQGSCTMCQKFCSSEEYDAIAARSTSEEIAIVSQPRTTKHEVRQLPDSGVWQESQYASSLESTVAVSSFPDIGSLSDKIRR